MPCTRDGAGKRDMRRVPTKRNEVRIFFKAVRLRVHRSGEKIRRGGAGITVGRSYRTYIFGIAPYYRKYTDVFSADGAFVLTFYILYDKIVVLVTNASQLVFN